MTEMFYVESLRFPSEKHDAYHSLRISTSFVGESVAAVSESTLVD